MAGYAGLFSNKYDTRANVNAGIDEMGMDWGRLSQPKYAGMAAAEGMMGYMSGLGNVNNAPEMKEQSLIDEIMAAHPDPKTPEELEALAADLQARGLTDYAFKVREVITEMKAAATTAAATSLRANTPNDAAFTRLTTGLSNRIITKEMVHEFMQDSWNNKDGSKYGPMDEEFQWDDSESGKQQYDFDYNQAKEQLIAEVENFSIHYQATSPSKIALNKFLLNPEQQIKDFKKYVNNDGKTKTAKFLSGQNVFIDDPEIDEDLLNLINR